MGAWASYSLSDLVLFSPHAYFRLYELLNAAIWPLQLVTVGIAVALLLLTRSPRAAVAGPLMVLLAVAWGVVAWWFFVERYAPINPVAAWYGAGFALQALALLSAGLWRGARVDLRGWRSSSASVPGLALVLYAVLVHPLSQLLAGRSWIGTEIVGVAPDPTALATLGFLLMARGRPAVLLALIPVLWCLVSALTYVALERHAGLLTPAVAFAAVLWAMFARRAGREDGAVSAD